VIDIDDNCVWSAWNGDKFTTKIYRDQLRYATPEEIAEEIQRRWWAKHDRKVWELKEGDVLKDIYQREIHEVVGIGFMGSVMFEGDTSYRAVDEIENKCTVVCFAEDRKDADHD